MDTKDIIKQLEFEIKVLGDKPIINRSTLLNVFKTIEARDEYIQSLEDTHRLNIELTELAKKQNEAIARQNEMIETNAPIVKVNNIIIFPAIVTLLIGYIIGYLISRL